MASEQIYENTAFIKQVRQEYYVTVDVGSTYFGYAFSPVDRPKDVVLNKDWAVAAGRSYNALRSPEAIFVSYDNER